MQFDDNNNRQELNLYKRRQELIGFDAYENNDSWYSKRMTVENNNNRKEFIPHNSHENFDKNYDRRL